MKHGYTDDTLQDAIDAACEETAKAHEIYLNALDLKPSSQSWAEETPARLHLLKTALANLPESPPPTADGKTPGQVAYEAMMEHQLGATKLRAPSWSQASTHMKESHSFMASAVLAAFGNKHPLATLAQNQVNLTPEQSAVVEQVLQSEVFGKPAEIPWTPWHGGPCPLKDEEVEEWEHKHVTCSIREVCKPSKISWKRNGTVSDIIAYRVTKWKEGFGPDSVESESEAPAEVAAPSTFTAHGKEWNVYNLGDSGPEDSERYIEIIDQDGHSGGYVKRYPHVNNWNITKGWRYADDETSGKSTSEVIITPEWTPAVGDVVTLRSGGPKMTVESITKDHAFCRWFDMNGSNQLLFNVATLTKAD